MIAINNTITSTALLLRATDADNTASPATTIHTAKPAKKATI